MSKMLSAPTFKMPRNPSPSRPGGASQKSSLDAESFGQAAQQAAAEMNRTNAFKRLGGTALAGLGVGAAGRGLVGLYNLLTPQHSIIGPKIVGQGTMPVPYPAETEEEEAQEKASNVGQFFKGDYATDASSIPWMMPASVLGGMGALYGGWKGMDHILDERRKVKLRGEVERAKADFNKAMLEQYDTEGKAASDRTLGQDLDVLYDQLEKVAFMGMDMGQLGGQAAGLYGTYAGLSGLMAGLAAHSYASKRSRRELLRKAQQQRARRLSQQRPTELYATPVPVQMPSRNAPDVNEREGDPLDNEV